MKHKTGIAHLYLIITFFCWGSLYVVNKFVMQSLPAGVVTCLRNIVALVVLLIMSCKIPHLATIRFGKRLF